MLQPIEVMALDENMNRASGGIAYRSLIWRRRYYECGSFELYVPKNLYKTTWKYIYTSDRPETGIIETVCATDDVHAWGGVDTVKVSGRFAESLLSRKVLLPSRVTGYGSTGDNVAVSMRWAEEIFGDRFAYIAPDFEGVERAMAPEAGPYGLILYDELKMAEASYRVLYDFTGNSWTLQPWKGLDRTQSQGGGIVPDPEPDVPDEPTIDDLYEPLDYIVATGEQYIDTGYCPNQDTDVEADFQAFETSDTALRFFGSRTSSVIYMLNYNSSAMRWFYGSSSTDDSTKEIAYTDRLSVATNGSSCVINGITLTGTERTFQIDYPMFIFGINSSGSLQSSVAMKLWSFSIKESGALVRDYVPKRRIADGAVGMLDLVNEVFYESASGVAFLAPGELPAGYTRLEYIESTGSQYIDTGVIPNSSTRVVTNARWTSIPTSSAALFGARNANTLQFWFFYYPSQTSMCVRYGAGSNSINVAGTATDWNLIDMNANTVSVGGNSASADQQTFTASHSLFLFGVNNAGSVQYPCAAMMKDCQIYQDGTTLTSDYLPAKNSGGEAGMFDLVTMTFLVDASDTGFAAGPEATAVAAAAEVASYAVAVASEETAETAVINAFALFSDQLGNIRDYVATKDASNYKNTCLIDYEYEEPAKWNSDGTPYAAPVYEWVEESAGTLRELVGYQIHYNIKRGQLTARIVDDLPDDETYLDLTGTKPPYDGEWSRSQYGPDALPDFPTDMQASYAAFPAALEAEGTKHLQANFPYVEEIDTGELATGGYLRRWDLGDRVDALLLDIGIDMEARITGVDECYEGATRSVTPIIGEKKHRRL